MPRIKTDLSGFGRKMRHLGDVGLERFTHRVVKAEVDIAERLMDKITPVDTGRMKRSWRRRVSRDSHILGNEAPYSSFIFFKKRGPARLDEELEPRLEAIVKKEFMRA